MFTFFNVQKMLYLSHTGCAAAPLFTLCLKRSVWAPAQKSALIGQLAHSVVIGQPTQTLQNPLQLHSN